MTKFPKTLLIFGADASKGFEKDCSKQPPLGGEVFQFFSKKYPNTWGSICSESELGTIFLNNFEKGMNTLLQSNSSLASNCHKALAREFFSFLPSRDNLYSIAANREIQDKKRLYERNRKSC